MAAKSVAGKLGITAKSSIWISDQTHESLIGDLPEGAAYTPLLPDAAVALIVVRDAASLRSELADVRDAITLPPAVWIVYPKGNVTDINRDSIWPVLAEYGMRPNGQIAVDDTWSSLRFRALRPGEDPFTGGR